uniref:Lysozyme n=1 Tax=Clavicipitaceae sp. TaxID=2011918 RepID=A0A7S6G7H1_9HYPO|nr:GH25 muramidase [Clavicipitaceae sp.]
MKLTSVLTLVGCAVTGTSAAVQGHDVSHWQGNINWGAVKAAGVKFTYIKATESTNYIDPSFNANYVGATNTGLIRGAYHFARPGDSSGAAQANYFVSHGGGWSADGRTLPGALDLEAGCSGLSQSAMTAWIRDFSNTYHARTGRFPVIYTTTSWWKTCTGNASGFQNDHPLWIARWGPSPGELPAGYGFHTFWQYADKGPLPGDQDNFNGDEAGLARLARGS